MTTTQHTGRLGEETAARWLLDHGFTLLHRNWRSITASAGHSSGPQMLI